MTTRSRLAAHALTLGLLLPGSVAVVQAQEAAFQAPEAIAATALSYLREQLSALPGQPSISIDPPRNERLTPCDAMSPFLPSGMKPRARMTVGIRCTAPKAWTAYVQASVSVPGQYYVASRTIAAGQALTPADLAPRDGDLVALPPGAITDPDTVAGMTAAYRITAGQPIKGAALRNAQSVVRGSNVRINAVGKGFMVSSEGQALDNAAPGATVQVRMPSGQVVSGVVRNAGLVEMHL